MSRPTKEIESGTQVTISLRVPAELKARLEERAAANHRNLSQETERALERSFSPEALFVDAVNSSTWEEGPKGRRALFDYLQTIAQELYGVGPSNAGLAMMRQLFGWLTYGEHYSPYKPDIEMIQTSIAAINEAIRQSEANGDVRPPSGQGQREKPEAMSAQHVRDALVSRIASGQWKPNAPIPKESDLAREFGVSSGIMRKALEIMESERLLTRRTYAAAPSKVYLFTASPSHDEAASDGRAVRGAAA
jgi:hypothetical protein